MFTSTPIYSHIDMVVVNVSDLKIRPLLNQLGEYGFTFKYFTHVLDSPTIQNLKTHVQDLDLDIIGGSYQPETIIAIGDLKTINMAKLLRTYFDNPNVNFDQLSLPFMESRWRSRLHHLHDRTTLVTVPTDYCSGFETSPVAYFQNDDKQLMNIRHDTFAPHTTIYSLLNSATKPLTRSLIESLFQIIEAFVSNDSTIHSDMTYLKGYKCFDLKTI